MLLFGLFGLLSSILCRNQLNFRKTDSLSLSKSFSNRLYWLFPCWGEEEEEEEKEVVKRIEPMPFHAEATLHLIKKETAANFNIHSTLPWHSFYIQKIYIFWAAIKLALFEEGECRGGGGWRWETNAFAYISAPM